MPQVSLRARRLLAVAAAILAAVTLGAGCAPDSPDAQPSSGKEANSAMPGMADSSTTMAGMSGMGVAEESFAFGSPAEPAQATRTVAVTMRDSFSYDPASIDVKVGETVLFEVTNAGKVVHEFVLGDHALQLDHDKEMQQMKPGMVMGGAPNAIAVKPGATKELAFTFGHAGDLEYACHQPGHYAAGMVGHLTVA